MRVPFDLGEVLSVAMAAAGVIYAITVFARAALRWRSRRIGALRFGRGVGGSTHIIPGPGHSEAEDCHCHPRVDGLPGQEFIEHRELKVRR